MAEATTADSLPAETGANDSPPPSRARSILKKAGWFGLALFFMIFFTVLKLPQDRIKKYIHGNIAAALSTQGIGFSAGKGEISILFGTSYVMKDVLLTFPNSPDPVRIQEIAVAPSILPMLLGKMGGKIWIRNAGGSVDGKFSIKQNNMSFDYTIKSLDLGKLAVLPAAAGMKGSAILSGEGEVQGDINLPSSFTGHVQLDLASILLEQQSFMGFSLPRLSISEGKADLTLDKGKAVIKTLRLGKPGSATDDIRANVTGDFTLQRQWPATTMSLNAQLNFSQNVLKSFVLLDALMGAGKQADGSYVFNINGSFMAPNAVPVAAAAPK